MSPRTKEPLTLEYALLGFLRPGPAHAYEIYQRLTQTEVLRLVWQIKQSQLYALLERLTTAGYLTSTVEAQGNRPPRNILHLTPSGESAYLRWVVEPVRHGRDFRQEFMAKLYFARLESQTAVASLIKQQQETCYDLRARFQKHLAALPTDDVMDRLVVQFRIEQMTGILAWLETCETTLLAKDHTLQGMS
jgi:PadR family transcriptional regulator, regulatory protein AphA